MRRYKSVLIRPELLTYLKYVRERDFGNISIQATIFNVIKEYEKKRRGNRR